MLHLDGYNSAMSSHAIDFDPDALRDKYRAERDKRLRADGNEQYLEVVGEYERYVDDPYVDPIEREPLFDEVEVLIIGGGFGGLLAGARLREAGIDDIRVVEKGGDFGGTWYWNRYPGAACDVESYIYLPLLEEIGYIPKEKYSQAAEILAHSQAIGQHFDLYRNACFQTEVTEMRWDDNDGRWIVTTNRGDAMRARYICMASGPLHRPKLPGIPGIDRSEGHTFHTSRWDYDYTGGDSDGNLDRPGRQARRHHRHGRHRGAVRAAPRRRRQGSCTCSSAHRRRSTCAATARPTRSGRPRSNPGGRTRRMENFNNLVTGHPRAGGPRQRRLDRHHRQPADPAARIGRASMSPRRRWPKTMELADFEKMEQIRARVDTIVNDPNTAEALKPYYRQFCKRPCFHDGYLDTFNRPNVDAGRHRRARREAHHRTRCGGRAARRRRRTSSRTEFEIDCLIYATGFEVGTDYTRRAGLRAVRARRR